MKVRNRNVTNPSRTILNPYKIINRLEDIRDLDVDGWEEFPEAIDDLIQDIFEQLDLPG